MKGYKVRRYVIKNNKPLTKYISSIEQYRMHKKRSGKFDLPFIEFYDSALQDATLMIRIEWIYVALKIHVTTTQLIDL